MTSSTLVVGQAGGIPFDRRRLERVIEQRPLEAPQEQDDLRAYTARITTGDAASHRRSLAAMEPSGSGMAAGSVMTPNAPCGCGSARGDPLFSNWARLRYIS